MLTVYNGGCMKELRKKFERKLGELKEETLFIREDFNARIGREGRKYEGREGSEVKRNSKDKIVNKERMEMLGTLEDRG